MGIGNKSKEAKTRTAEAESAGKICFISLGCVKNLVDTEHMLGLVMKQGYVPVQDPMEADIVVINTCGFLQSAVKEAIDTILETAALKRDGNLRKLVVTGCFVQRYGYRLANEIPEVDAWLGTGAFLKIPQVLSSRSPDSPAPFVINRPKLLPDHTMPRERTTPFYTAYLRIAEGCSHPCSYCMIPALRGPLRSRNISSLVQEAKAMVDQGVKEINLIAQDTTAFGKDRNSKFGLEDLIESLLTVKGLFWIRLLYCHPAGITDRLLTLLESESALCPYLDLPVQHVNPEILKIMARPELNESLFEMVARIRSLRRPLSLRTSLIVGFPGETDDIFQELLAFVRYARFEHLGVFVFSPEKGTPAARLKSTVPAEVAEQRRKKIMTLQADIAKDLNQQYVGKTVPALIEGLSPETALLLKARTAAMAPDVDAQVLINKGRGEVGKIMPVRITEAYAYDLIGEIVER